MSVLRSLAGVSGVVVALTAFGPSVAAEPADDASSVDAWLTLQREGDKAVPQYKRVEGEMSQRAYRRMLESFEHPIPAQMLDDELSAGPGR